MTYKLYCALSNNLLVIFHFFVIFVVAALCSPLEVFVASIYHLAFFLLWITSVQSKIRFTSNGVNLVVSNFLYCLSQIFVRGKHIEV